MHRRGHLRLLAPPEDRAHLVALLAGSCDDAERLADLLLSRFGSFRRVVSARSSRVRHVAGPTAADALQIFRGAMVYFTRSAFLDRPAVSSDPIFQDYLQADMAGLTTERFRALLLDARMRIVGEHLSHGTLDEAAVYIREVLHLALDLGAAGILLIHNHPSGDLSPSAEDISLTCAIKDAARPLRIALHDHVIVAAGGAISLRAEGFI